MTPPSSKNVLREVELAIHDKNYARMYSLGVDLIKQSGSDHSWLEAAAIIASYLANNKEHTLSAVDLSKQAVLAAPINSQIQDNITKTFLICVNTLPEAKDRIDAVQSVVTQAVQAKNLVVICLDTMMDNIPQLKDANDKARYIKLVIDYAPSGSPTAMRATIMENPHRQTTKQEDEDFFGVGDKTPTSTFVHKYSKKT
jgi:hypothetical protein